jgi:hypothetical protein
LTDDRIPLGEWRCKWGANPSQFGTVNASFLCYWREWITQKSETMTAGPNYHWGLHWRYKATHVKRDPAVERLHRDGITSLIVLGVMAMIFVVIIALSAILSAPAGNETIGLLIMP